jgi:hypothetical protein
MTNPNWSPAQLTPLSGPSRLRWGVPVGALVLGALLGAAVGFLVGHADPRQSEEYRALQGELAGAQERAGVAEQQAREAEEKSDNVADSYRRSAERLKEQEAELAAREEKLAAREEAVAAVEKRVAETSIGEGVWTVGVDVEPGTYRVAEPLAGECYWKITASGTNGADIVENDIPTGGRPTVTLRKGQDFTNNGCGTFVRQ